MKNEKVDILWIINNCAFVKTTNPEPNSLKITTDMPEELKNMIKNNEILETWTLETIQ